MCSKNKLESKSIERVTAELNRAIWTEGLYVNKNDLDKVKRYKNSDGSYKNNFDIKQFLEWVNIIEQNTVICDMEHKDIGKGVFVPYGKKIPKGTFIPSSGIIKLNPTQEELATKVHCSALQDLDTPTRKIYGFIDPSQIGGILDLINHAPDKNEIAHFDFQNVTIKKRVSTSNLNSTIKFYKGYAIMGLEAFEDIGGGEQGQQLLWSYARTAEYLEHNTSTLDHPILFLFDNRNGTILDPSYYALKKIHIYINKYGLNVQKIASLTRWELMENSSDTQFLIVMNPNATNSVENKQLFIEKNLLRGYLQNNPSANRIILDLSNN